MIILLLGGKTLSTKDSLLTLFLENKGKYFSGEEIASKLNVSRTAVWKAVNSIKKEGYTIDAIQNKGYCLKDENDILSLKGVSEYLDNSKMDLKLNVVASIDSTNIKVREMALEGESEGYTVISACQTLGRGRKGRSFFSPKDSGVYLSILLKPQNYTAKKAARITTMAAVAVCEAIEAISDKKAQIKWVNDIFVNGKKVCGILTEASFNLETGFLDYAVLGVGINVNYPKEGFPEELKNIAGAVFDEPCNDARNRIAAEFLNHFLYYYLSQEKKEYVLRYKERSLAIGRQVTVLSGNDKIMATAVDIDDECHLIVRYEDGSEEALSSGEISIRL